jgi:hypothetical protein
MPPHAALSHPHHGQKSLINPPLLHLHPPEVPSAFVRDGRYILSLTKSKTDKN